MAKLILEATDSRQFEVKAEIPDELALAWLGITGAGATTMPNVTAMPGRVLEFMRQSPDRLFTTDEIATALKLDDARRTTLYGALNRLSVGTDPQVIKVAKGQFRLRVAAGQQTSKT